MNIELRTNDLTLTHCWGTSEKVGLLKLVVLVEGGVGGSGASSSSNTNRSTSRDWAVVADMQPAVYKTEVSVWRLVICGAIRAQMSAWRWGARVWEVNDE